MTQIKKIDLALQGGGAHGAYSWGVIDRLLDEPKIEIDGICGTSAGAMNGVCTIYGLSKGGRNLAKHTLVKFWHKISEAGKLSPLQPTWFDKMLSPGNMDYSPLYKLFSVTSENIAPQQYNPLGFNPLEKILNELIDFEELQKISPPKLFVCATNVKTCKAKVFGPTEITCKAVLASACLPYLFDAVKINGEYYWDGGYMGNPPLWPLTKGTVGTDDILLVKINPFKIDEVPSNSEEIKDRVNEISFNSSLALEIEHLEFINNLIDKGVNLNGQLKKIQLHSLSADNTLSNLNLSSKLNTTWDFLMHLKNKGYEACDKWISKNYENIGKQSTYTI
ncbi:MAG: patatin-like phospholipase family protein [Bacteroidetes bacterium]|nr:patatin-like phospholipase family protein [Bacteroidota bacterium]